ncbi:MAG: hypothetical protein Q8P55_02975 [bacterium]|nr:hypothetical protein [bacterium]
MEPLVIQRMEETNEGWRFIVEIGRQDAVKIGFAATLDRDYWKELTFQKHSPERLIQETFRFLLAKEVAMTAVVRELGNSFNLRDIPTHYYSYERRMKFALFGTDHPEP